MSSARPFPDRSTLGAGFQTALRKCLDGDLSVIMYNAVHGLADELWAEFVDHVMDGIRQRGRFDAGSLRASCLDYANDYTLDPRAAEEPAL